MANPLSKAGIYMICNLQNGKMYIGQSCNILNRWRAHRNALRRGDHGNPHLQAAWEMYGEDTFEFSVLHYGSEDLDALETQYMMQYESLNPDKGYNLEYVIEGVKAHSPETKAKIAAGNKGKTISLETREKMRIANLGKKASPETLEKMRIAGRLGKGKPKPAGFGESVSQFLSGKAKSSEHRKHISESKKGCKLTPEVLAKSRQTLSLIHESRRGKPLSDKTRRAIGDANKGRVQTPEERARRSASLKGRPKTPEQIKAAVEGKARARQQKENSHDK